VEVPFTVGGAKANLAVGIQVAWRDDDIIGRFDDEQIRLCAGLKFQTVGRTVRNHDVVIRLERMQAEHRVEHALAAMNEQDLIRGGVAIQLFLRLGWPTARELDIHIHHEG
jgi:hypothetical protein